MASVDAGVRRAGQQPLGKRAAEADESRAFLLQPLVECRIETIQILQQRVAEDGETSSPCAPAAARRRHRSTGWPAQQQIVAVGDEQVRPIVAKHILQLMHALAQRGPGLFALPPAPEQRGDGQAQDRLWAGKGEDRQEGPGLARAREVEASGLILYGELPEQPQTQPFRIARIRCASALSCRIVRNRCALIGRGVIADLSSTSG